jgi:hypothetical protein
MRRLIFRPLVLVLTFLLGLLLTSLLTLAGDGLARLLDEPSETIPALCRGDRDSASVPCSQPAVPGDEEAAVYSALIEQADVNELGSLVVIQDQTVRGDYFPFDASQDGRLDRIFGALKRDFRLADEATLTSFRANNERAHPMIDHPFLRQIESKLISPQSIPNASHVDWWETFRQTYPGATGFFLFSKVGFNSEMNQALVYRAFACADTCGYGSYVLLVKEDGAWRIKTQAGHWIS